MIQAQLINRGEQFAVIEGSTRFEGECSWSWERPEGERPQPVYPIHIYVQSIRKRGAFWQFPLTAAEKLRVARLAKQLLESREGDNTVVLVEDARAPSAALVPLPVHVPVPNRPAPSSPRPPSIPSPVGPVEQPATQRQAPLQRMDQTVFAARIEGYMLAVARLKWDGTAFDCTSLGAMHPLLAGAEASKVLRVPHDDLVIEEALPVSAQVDFPASLQDWILTRVQPLHDHPLDQQLVDALREELHFVFGAPPEWFTLHWKASASTLQYVAPIRDSYLFGTKDGAFLLNCEWDS